MPRCMEGTGVPRDWWDGRRLRAWELHRAGWSGARRNGVQLPSSAPDRSRDENVWTWSNVPN